MEDLQQAYAAYQQALYHLRDPKVSIFPQPDSAPLTKLCSGAEIVVWYWHTL